MNDPKRLLSEGGTGSAAQSLLRALTKPEAPSAEKEAELVAQLLASPAPLAASVGAASSWLSAAALALALLGVGIAGTFWLTSRPPEVPLPPALPAPSVAPVVALPEPPPDPVPSSVVVPAPVRSAPARRPALDTLAEEAELLEQARRVSSSAPSRSLSLLRQHQARFPAGQLAAERSFLLVQVLEKTGDSAGAQREARALVRRYPRSVYATELRERAASRKTEGAPR